MANIASILTQIRNAIYGGDVRDSIADGIESINQEVESNTTRQDSVEARQTSLENEFNEQIENAISDNPSSAETVQARGTHGKLVDRLNSVDEHLADIPNQTYITEKAKQTDVNSLVKNRTNWINMRSLGADNTGTTDCSQIIRDALVNYDVLYFPTGIYKVDSSIDISSNGKVILGDGMNTIITFTSTTSNLFNISAGSFVARNFVVLNVNSTTTNAIAFYFTTGGFTIDNVKVKYGAIGLKVYVASGTTHTGTINKFVVNYTIVSALDLIRCCDVFITNCVFDGNMPNADGSMRGNGISLTGNCQALVFKGVSVLRYRYGLWTKEDVIETHRVPAYNKFINCYFDSNSNEGIRLANFNTLTFTDCWFSNRPGLGVNITGGSDVTFNGCSFLFGGNTVIAISANTEYVTISDCSILNNNGWAIVASSNAKLFAIIGCKIGNTTVNNARFGIDAWVQKQSKGIDIATGCTAFIIKDNLLTGNTSAGIDNHSVETNVVVVNNITY